MKNIKEYTQFLVKEQLSPSDIFSSKETGEKLIAPEIRDVNTQDLLSDLSKKIREGDSSPVYAFNFIPTEENFFVSAELFKEAKSFGLDIDPQDNSLITSRGKYTYCILKFKEFNPNLSEITEQLLQLVGKNRASGMNNIIEFLNISVLNPEIIKDLSSMIISRKIKDFSMDDSDLFILTDNSNSKVGGKDLSNTISGYFLESPISIYRHQLSLNSETSNQE